MAKTKSIIKRMKQLIDIYKFVKWLDNETKNIDPTVSWVRKEDKYIHIQTNTAISDYMKQLKKGKSEQEIATLVGNSLEKGYLAQILDIQRYGYIRANAKGRYFTEKTAGLIPLGLLNEILKEYGHFWSFVTGSAFAGFLVITLYYLGYISVWFYEAIVKALK